MRVMASVTSEPFLGFTCDLPVNTGGAHWLLNAAIYHLNEWVKNGNTLGGVRSPHVDAPIATLGGTDNAGSGSLGQFCRLFGSTVPFSTHVLAALTRTTTSSSRSGTAPPAGS
jgi:hypothetical protein